MPLNPEQAQQMFDKGFITQDQLTQISNRQPAAEPVTPEPVVMPNVAAEPVTPEPTNFGLLGQSGASVTPVSMPIQNADMDAADQDAVLDDMDPYQAEADAVVPQEPDFSEQLKGFDEKEKAIQKMAEQGVLEAEKQAAMMEQQSQLANQKTAEEDASLQAKIDKANEAMLKLNEKNEEIDSMKVDRSNYWSSKSTGEKIMAGIALALGAIGAQRGGRNYAAEMISGQIDKDLQLQQQAINEKRRGVAAKKGVYASMLDTYQDERMALAASKSHYIADTQNKIQAQALRSKSKEAKARADMMVADLQMKKGEAEEQLKNRAMQLASFQSGEVNPAMLDAKTAERYVAGMGVAYDKSSAKKMREYVTAAKDARYGIGELMKLSKKPGRSLSLQDRAKADSVRNLLMGALRVEVLGPGTVQEAERQILKDLIADPTKMFSLNSTVKTRLQTLLKKVDKGLANKASVYIMGGGPKQIRTLSPDKAAKLRARRVSAEK